MVVIIFIRSLIIRRININISSGLWAVRARERESERERERERRYSSKRSSIIGSRWYVPGNGGGGSGGEGWGGFFL